MSEDDRPPAILPPGLGAMGLGGGERDASQASNHRLQTRPWWVSGMRWSVVGGLLFMLALALALPALGRAQEQQPNQAGLVIQHGDGRVVTACVSFAEPEISGVGLLERAGVSYIAQTGGGGSAVCKLDGEGCDYPAEDCFCKCKGAECVYWAYQSLRGGKWSYSQIGAASFRVKPGDVQGWAWGAGSVQSGAQPPILALDQICAAPAAQPTVILPAPTEPPAPTAQPPTEPLPTAQPQPSPLPTRAAAPKPSPSGLGAAATATRPVAPTKPATAAPTLAPQPTLAPATAQPAAAAPTVSGAPTATFGSAGAAATPTPGVADGSSAVSYLAFGAIALVLVGGIVAALLRRRAP